MLALFRPLCWCFMPWLYSGLYTEGLYYGFILGFILGFMSLGRGVSVAPGAVLALYENFLAIEIIFLGVVQGGQEPPRALFSFMLCFIHALYTSARLYLCLSI